jgi:hypothetical protein
MIYLGVTAILESAHIYLKAGNAFGFSNSFIFIFVSVDSKINLLMLATTLKADYIGRDYWRDKAEYERMRRRGSFKGSSLFFVGAIILPNIFRIIPSGP